MFLYFLDSKVLKRNAEIIVICYHDIGEEGGFSVRLKDFIRQIEYLRTKYFERSGRPYGRKEKDKKSLIYTDIR